MTLKHKRKPVISQGVGSEKRRNDLLASTNIVLSVFYPSDGRSMWLMEAVREVISSGCSDSAGWAYPRRRRILLVQQYCSNSDTGLHRKCADRYLSSQDMQLSAT